MLYETGLLEEQILLLFCHHLHTLMPFLEAILTECIFPLECATFFIAFLCKHTRQMCMTAASFTASRTLILSFSVDF